MAINKPHGLLVHRSPIATNVDTFAVQELRNQLDRHVFPVHRLDRKTSGVLLFALEENSLKNKRRKQEGGRTQHEKKEEEAAGRKKTA